jgi:hypothetical protein
MAEYLDFSSSNNKQQINDTNLLFNKTKISPEIASMSSMSSMSSASSIRSTSKKNTQKPKQFIEEIEQPKKLINPNINKKIVSNKNNYKNDKDEDDDDDNDDNEDDDDEDDDDEDDDDEDDSRSSCSDDEEEGEDDDDDDEENQKSKKKGINPYKDELNEKKEILYQLNRLQAKGAKIPVSFTLNSNIEDMRHEYNRIIKDRDIDSSVRFQRKMLMAFVTGTEYLNTRYDPFSIKLEGWSEQVHENIDDFDDIFEELHMKYKSKGKAMPPELRLFISLSGSAFMFHLTSKMFKESSIPGVEEVLKANPELMKQFQNAAAKQFIYNNISTPKQSIEQPKPQNNGGGVNGLFNNSSGLFGMVNNLFSGLNNNKPEMNLSQSKPMPPPKAERDINNIINNVHNKISIHQPDDDAKIETLSISDEEITSIIEDATDIKILKGSTRGKKNNNRTLNI